MSHGFYSRASFQPQYPPQQYAQSQTPYPNLDRTTQPYSATAHSPQAVASSTGHLPTHSRSTSDFAAMQQQYPQPPYPAQPYTLYGQQPPPPQQPPFSPFTQPASGYQQPPATASQSSVANIPRFQHQHSQSVPVTYPPTSSAYSTFAPQNQQLPGTSAYPPLATYGAQPGVGHQPPAPLSDPGRVVPAQPPASLYGFASTSSQPESVQSLRTTAGAVLPRNSTFVPPVFGSRARSASPLPPAGDLMRAPTVASARSLDSGLANKRPLPNAPGIGTVGSLPSVRERTNTFEGDTKTKQFTYPGRESPTKTGYIPYNRDAASTFASRPSPSAISSGSGSPPKPTYAAQPTVNPRTAPFDPFSASRISQMASSPPKTGPATFGLGESPTRSFPSQPVIPPPAPMPPFAPTWPHEKVTKPDPASSTSVPTSKFTAGPGSTSPTSPSRRPNPPFAPNYKREPSPGLPPYSSKAMSPPTAKTSLPDENDWDTKKQEWGRERDRAEDAIARAREIGKNFLQERGVLEPKSEAAAIAEEYLSRKGLGRSNPSPERPTPATSSYVSAPPTRRFQSPERRANETWKSSSPSRKDRWGEPKGDYIDHRWAQPAIRRRESPERGQSSERQGGYVSPERRTSPSSGSGPLPKPRSQRTFPSDGDYVQHRSREPFQSNGNGTSRHRHQGSEPARSPRNEYYEPPEDEHDDPPIPRDISRRELDEEPYEQRSFEQAPPPTRGNYGTWHAQSRREPQPMSQEPQPSPPRTRQSSPERPPPRQQPQPRPQPQSQSQPSPQSRQPRSSPQSHPQPQQQRPCQAASPVTSSRTPNGTPQHQPATAPRQSMAMRMAAQALADEGKPWPTNTPQLPRAPPEPRAEPKGYDTPCPAMERGALPPRTPSPPETDPEDEYEKPPQEWQEPPAVSPRRQPIQTSPRKEPPRAIPQPKIVAQEDEYEYDEPPHQWRQPMEKPKMTDIAPKREPLRENTQPAFARPRPPARKETSREAALRRPVPPPPPPASVPQPQPQPQSIQQRPPPPVRSPSPARAPAITFRDDDPAPAPGLPTFSFDLADEPAGPTINVTSPREPDPSGPRIQADEVPSISIIEDSRPQVTATWHNDRVESPIRHAGGLRCAGCDGAIVGRIVSAMGFRWHPHCFKCDDCGTLLEHVSSYEHNGKAYCHLDYHDRFAPRCYHCKTPIVDERFIALDDPALGGQRYYHELHFFCAECGDPFLDPSASSAAPPAARGQIFGEGDGDDDVGFTVFNGHPYCESCHVRLRMPRCGSSAKSGRPGPAGVGCGKPIREEAIEALGRKWHWKCFTCDSCKKPFEDPSFFQREDCAFCDPCYRILLKNEF